MWSRDFEGSSSWYKKFELSSLMTSKRTTLVCWALKGFNEMKTGLIQRKPGTQVPKDTHTPRATFKPSFALSHWVSCYAVSTSFPLTKLWVYCFAFRAKWMLITSSVKSSYWPNWPKTVDLIYLAKMTGIRHSLGWDIFWWFPIGPIQKNNR